MVLLALELLAITKTGNRWRGQQEDCDHAGMAAVDNEAAVAEACSDGRLKTQLKNTSFNTSFDTPRHSPQTQTAPPTQTTPPVPLP